MSWACDHQDRLDLGEVVRVVAGEQLDAAAVGHPESRGRVGDRVAGDQRDEARRTSSGRSADAANRVAGSFEEAAAPDHLGLAGVERLLELGQLRGVVLAVAVDLDGHLVAVEEGVAVARLDGAADPEVEGVGEDDRAGVRGQRGGLVGRAVVDHEHVVARRLAAQLLDQIGDRALFVQGRNDRDLLAPRVHQAREDTTASAARGPASPSQWGMCGGRSGGSAASAACAASRSAAGSRPTSVFVPSSTVTGRSVVRL